MLKTCPSCKKEKNIKKDFYQTKSKKNGQSFCKGCFSTYCMERWKKRKIEMIEYKGGKCSTCKNSFHWSIYDFHHLDKSTKEYSWDKMKSMSEEKCKKELEKCILLCSNCHRLEHYKEMVSSSRVELESIA